MVQLEVVRAANTAFFQSRPFVAAFAGATAGIGEATLRALATAHGVQGKGLRAYVVGRNKEATEKILADCSRLCPAGEFIFVLAKDLSLLEEVDKVCSGITRAEKGIAGKDCARIDLLCMSQGDFNFSPRRGSYTRTD
jgi:NAD(P)-dependent dehydrogenase (short-subunit alcohol dehydrogenase family)